MTNRHLVCFTLEITLTGKIFHMYTVIYDFHFIQTIISKPILLFFYPLSWLIKGMVMLIFKILKVKTNPYFSGCRNFVLILKVEEVIFCRLMYILSQVIWICLFITATTFCLPLHGGRNVIYLSDWNGWYKSLFHLLN